MIYLWKKDIDDQTGFETYVFLKLNEILSDGERQHKRAPDVSWFPNSEAMAIPDLRAANNDFLLSSRLDALSASAQVLLPLSKSVDPRALPATRTLRASMCARSCAKMPSVHSFVTMSSAPNMALIVIALAFTRICRCGFESGGGWFLPAGAALTASCSTWTMHDLPTPGGPTTASEWRTRLVS